MSIFDVTAQETLLAADNNQTVATHPRISIPAPVASFNMFAASPTYLTPALPRHGLRINVFSVAQVVNVVYAD